MNRMLATLRTDITVQIRNRLYLIGPFVAVIVGVMMLAVVSAPDFYRGIPVILLLVTGGTTQLYVAGLILFEKDEGTLYALIASPLRTWEYMLSKVLTLTLLATLESLVLVGLVTRFQEFNLIILLIGILLIGVMYTLIGIVMIVRYRSITDFLIPALFVSLVLQLPLLHFLNLIESPLWLLIPTSAPTMLMQGAWRDLSSGEWLYAVGYSLATIALLAGWSYRAFYRQIVLRAD